jgi:hypothetical protein
MYFVFKIFIPLFLAESVLVGLERRWDQVGKEVLQQREANRTKLCQTNNEVYVLTSFVLGHSQTTVFPSFVKNKSFVNLVLSSSLLDT